MGRRSGAAGDMAINSAAAVLRAISVCSLEDHKTGKGGKGDDEACL
jgi:hypothetical protein